jgi:hypothetical protein
MRALVVTIICVFTCVASEYIWNKILCNSRSYKRCKERS